jgi:MOSC domain-containing protein YiiM
VLGWDAASSPSGCAQQKRPIQKRRLHWPPIASLNARVVGKARSSVGLITRGRRNHMPQPAIVGVYSGGIETIIAPDGRPMTTGIRKRPVALGSLELDGFPGDASTDADHHTKDKTAHLFSDENYRLVETRLGLTLPKPTFGENLTTSGMLEDGVYVGDRFRVGTATICVTQPTERCKAIGRSLGVPKILRVLHELEVCGFYACVVEPGHIAVGDPVELCDRPQSTWSIKRLHHFMFHKLADDRLLDEVLAVPELSVEWKRRVEVMRGRLRRGEPLSSNLVGL